MKTEQVSGRASRRKFLHLLALMTAGTAASACYSGPASVITESSTPQDPAISSSEQVSPIVEALELEIQRIILATVSYLETVEDIRESAKLLCGTANADERLFDLHISYYWDIVDSQQLIADSAQRAFSQAIDAGIEIRWDAEAFLTILEHPELGPYVNRVDEPSADNIVQLQSEEAVLAYLGLSRLEDVPDLLDRNAQQLEQSLRDRFLEFDLDELCFGGLEFTDGEAPVADTFLICRVDPVSGEEICVEVPIPEAFEGVVEFVTVVGIILIVAALIAAIILIFTSRRDRKGDAARKQIEEWSEDEIRSVTVDSIKELLFHMMNDGTGRKQEEAILKVLRALGCERARDELLFDSDVPTLEGESVPDRHGNWYTWIYNTMSGREKSEFIEFLNTCGLLDFSSSVMSRNDVRNFVEHADCGTLLSLTDAQLITILRRILNGEVGDRAEDAIIKLFRCPFRCDRVRTILSTEGLTREDFRDKVQGEQWEELWPLFARCAA